MVTPPHVFVTAESKIFRALDFVSVHFVRLRLGNVTEYRRWGVYPGVLRNDVLNGRNSTDHNVVPLRLERVHLRLSHQIIEIADVMISQSWITH